ncbi:tyrosine-type recombinase/integrase [Carboxylicivirga marina]|uniref:tyrosine-type recombinase/integrase n=1 Tax=Carboxylicivirga marina TaxID=2800988 RepID=UPI00259AA420|nr:site-specific integrase [uncultured Carboxylicivirga sp.]
MLNSNYPYKKAVLKDRLGDLNKRWYVTFKVWDVQLGKLRPKYDYEVNKHPTKEARYRFAKRLIKQINQMLEGGKHIDNEKNKAQEPQVVILTDAFYEILDIKRNEYSRDTFNSYKSKVDQFTEWLREKKKHKLPVEKISTQLIISFIDYKAKDGRSAKTLNSYVDTFKAIYSELRSRHTQLPNNPFAEIPKRKELVSHKNMAYLGKEKDELIYVIKKIKPNLFSFVQFMYYTFMRPNEIRQLQVYNIQLEDNLIFIEAFKSKSKKDAFITIPPPFKTTLKKLIENKPNSAYLFPGKTATCISKNRMSDYHREILERFDWRNTNHTLYSWKHTGVIDAYKAGIDIKSLQLQLRHHSLEETDTYLKSLGMYTNKAILTKMPALIQ